MLCKRMKKLHQCHPPRTQSCAAFLAYTPPSSAAFVSALPAFADGDPLTVVNNLSTFIFSLIRAIGLILLGWGIVRVGLSLQSHDPSQRSQDFSRLRAGWSLRLQKKSWT